MPSRVARHNRIERVAIFCLDYINCLTPPLFFIAVVVSNAWYAWWI